MPFSGKRSARERIPSQVNLDPDLVSIISDRAARNLRTKGAEIVHLLTFAILNDPEANIHEHFRIHASNGAHPLKTWHRNPDSGDMCNVGVTAHRRAS